jgi:hypothetical protein
MEGLDKLQVLRVPSEIEKMIKEWAFDISTYLTEIKQNHHTSIFTATCNP